MFQRVVWSAALALTLSVVLGVVSIIQFYSGDVATATVALAGASVTLALLALREDR